MHRCALALLRESPQEARNVQRAFGLFHAYHGHGVLPSSGGSADQSASVMAAFRIAQTEIGIVERHEREKIERKQERERMRADAMRAAQRSR